MDRTEEIQLAIDMINDNLLQVKLASEDSVKTVIEVKYVQLLIDAIDLVYGN
jgi:hypothetical protein